MSIIRTLGVTVASLEDKAIITQSTAGIPSGTYALQTTQASTGNVLDATSTGSGVITGNGRVIDRLSDLFTKDVPLVAIPATQLYSSRGSTAADRKLSLGVKLQHGDSSGGGDMADYSTQSQPDDRVYFSSARSSDAAVWSTGPARLLSNPAYYDLRAAKRYIRAVHIVTKNGLTTESTGDEGARLSGSVTFLGLHTPDFKFTGVGSGSTTT